MRKQSRVGTSRHRRGRAEGQVSPSPAGIGVTRVFEGIRSVHQSSYRSGRLVGHGTRHTASTLLREHGWAKDHVEAQLSHVEDGVAGDYNQAMYLTQRTAMMQWYVD